MSQDLQCREPGQRAFQLGEAGIIVEPVGSADPVGNVEYEREPGGFTMGKQVLATRILERQVGHYLAHALHPARTVMVQPAVERGGG